MTSTTVLSQTRAFVRAVLTLHLHQVSLETARAAGAKAGESFVQIFAQRMALISLLYTLNRDACNVR